MKLFVIGDIHGCLVELKKLLELTDKEIKEGDVYVFLGDYIDRGPDSKGVIDLLIERSKNHPNKHIFLMGNHEDMMIHGRDYWALNGGLETLNSYGLNQYDYVSYWSLIPEEHREFLNQLNVFYQHDKVVCVHAGIDPELSLEDQNEHDMIWNRKFVGYSGEYAGGLFVIYGHTPRENMFIRPNQLGIDTACVFGEKLTCAIVDPEFPSGFRTIEVKSEFEY